MQEIDSTYKFLQEYEERKIKTQKEKTIKWVDKNKSKYRYNDLNPNYRAIRENMQH